MDIQLPLYEKSKLVVTTEACVIFKDKVLMQRRSLTKKFFPGALVLPGGKVNYGEDLLSATIRELKEETGIEVKEDKISLSVNLINHHLDRDETWLITVFKAFVEDDKISQTEEGENLWINIEDVKKDESVFEPVKFYFDHIFLDSKDVLYSSATWKNAKLVEVLSKRIEKRNF